MLIRVYLNLLVACIFLPLLNQSLFLLLNVKNIQQEIADLIAVRQLQQILLIAYEREITSDELLFHYKGKQFCLKRGIDKLVLSPGSQIFFVEAKNFEWLVKDNYIYLKWQRGKQTYEAPITKEKGLSRN